MRKRLTITIHLKDSEEGLKRMIRDLMESDDSGNPYHDRSESDIAKKLLKMSLIDERRKVEAIDHDEAYASRFEKISKEGATETDDITVIKNVSRRTHRPPAAGRRTGGSPPQTGRHVMNPNLTHQWSKPYGAYASSELRAMTFPSIEEIEKAIDLLWNDPELKGVPSDSPDGMTLFIPAEAVDLLKQRGLKFTVSKLIDLKELSYQELKEARLKHGM